MAENSKMSDWANQLVNTAKAGVANFFIIHGNIFDSVRTLDGTYVDLPGYLSGALFNSRELVMFYSLSTGLRFSKEEEMLSVFNGYLDRMKFQAPMPDAGSALGSAVQGAKGARSAAPVSQRIGKLPKDVFPVLEKVFTMQPENKGANTNTRKVLIIEFGHNIAPNSSAAGAAASTDDRINTEIMLRWASDPQIRAAGHIIIFLAPSIESVSKELRDFPSAEMIRVPKPNEDERSARWNFHERIMSLENGITIELLGKITNGLSLKQIDSIAAMAKNEKTVLNLDMIRQKKQDILREEFGDRIEIKDPEFGFEAVGGLDKIKQYLLGVRDNIMSGMFRRVPMGLLALGPPGTCKTWLLECFAHECGFSCVQMRNLRSMWNGQTEEFEDGFLDTLDDISPVLVIEDEADQSEGSRGGFDGDNGVSSRWRQKKFQFCSDPKRRGKVLWVRISNRPDLIDVAYKRKGRTDEIIPFILPTSQAEINQIIKVMFLRYNIPTNITEFAPFAEMIASKKCCTGADIEWMVREADQCAGDEGKGEVEAGHLEMAIDHWVTDQDYAEIARQTILAIKSSSVRLRPDNWEQILDAAKEGSCQMAA